MSPEDKEQFHAKLVNFLTTEDIKLSKKDRNIYRLGIYLQAADRVMEAIEVGSNPADAFTENFTPCREMHRVSKKLGLGLDVNRGQWVKGGVNASS